MHIHEKEVFDMGIQSISNFVLALRNNEEARTGRRSQDECVPELLVSGENHAFRKKGQRIFLMTDEIPLVETLGNQHFSEPVARIRMIEVTHFVEKGEVWTRGRYLVVDTFKEDGTPPSALMRIKC